MIKTKFRTENIDSISLNIYKSAIQKYIRRSESDKAKVCINNLSLFFQEFEDNEKDVSLKRITTNILHRIMVIFLEDVGIEGLKWWKEIDKCLLTYYKSVGGLENAVKIMSDKNIPKSRLCSHLIAFYNDKDRDSYKYIHTPVIVKFFESKDPFELLKTEFKFTDEDELFQLSKKWYKELKNLKESYLCWAILLAYSLFYKQPINFISNNYTLKPSFKNTLIKIDISFFDDYVFDKHTKDSKDASEKYFALVSSKVIPESFYVDPLLKTIYIHSKTPYHFERDFGTFKFRMQLTTSKFKTDVYLIELNNKLYVLKGPFLDVKKVSSYIDLQSRKKKYDIDITKNRLIYLIPDRFDTVPLGIRNYITKNIYYPFLLSKCVIQDISEFKLKTHSSKLWPPTVVVDSPLHLKDLEKDLNTHSLKVKFLNIIGFRCKHNLSDIALRNILLYKNKLYSIDEESVNDNFSLSNELKKKNYNILLKWLDEYKMNEELYEELKRKIVQNE